VAFVRNAAFRPVRSVAGADRDRDHLHTVSDQRRDPPGKGEPQRFVPGRNTAIVLDTDSTFHGVELVPGWDETLRHIDRSSVLVPDGRGHWSLKCGTPGQLREVATYRTGQLRLSLSWKAYCFSDADEREAWSRGTDALTMECIIAVFVEELIRRGRLVGPDHGLSDEEFGLLVIGEFIRFPDEPCGY
jgi:hypothetical protein